MSYSSILQVSPLGPGVFMACSPTACHGILYQGEGSKHQIWNTFGWIYDTSVAMVHIALAGVFRRYPGVLWKWLSYFVVVGNFPITKLPRGKLGNLWHTATVLEPCL